jgi:hypothetical protein
MVLGVVQIVATILICIFAAIYKDSYCEVHFPRRLAPIPNSAPPGEPGVNEPLVAPTSATRRRRSSVT